MSIVDTRRRAIVALNMGPTGTGKSTFIKLLTKEDNIPSIGHNVESETIDVSTGHPVTLVDTPGFDDSREGVTHTDILKKIADFLLEGEGRKLDGIIYLHRISDPRMGGSAKKNLRMFRELCGDENLPKVRIVTTGWNVVKEKEGNVREAALRNGAFKPLIDLGAKMLRQDKEEESARHILSTLIKSEPPMTLKFQKELNEGKALGETSAGAVIMEELLELRKEHDKEMEELRKVMIEQATMENVFDELRAELAARHRDLEELETRTEDDKRRLAKTRMVRRRHKGGQDPLVAQDRLRLMEERQLRRPIRERTPNEETVQHMSQSNRRNAGELDNHVVWFVLCIWSTIVTCFLLR